MSKWGLEPRILSLALVPTLLVALLMSIFFIQNHYRASQKSLIERGSSLSSNIALAGEYDLAIHNHENLKKISSLAVDSSSDISSIAFFDTNLRPVSIAGSVQNNKVFDIQSFGRSLETQSEQKNNYQQFNIKDDGIVFYAPVIASSGASLAESEDNALYYSTNHNIIGYVATFMSNDSIKTERLIYLITSIVFSLLGLIIGIVLAKRMSNNVTTPINKMIEGVNLIKEGHLESRIQSNAQTELRILEEGINAMAEQLERNQDELQLAVEQSTQDLQDTLETLEINNLELDLARKQAIEASRVKTEFLANMGHEIRTPMNGVIGFTNLLLKTELNNKQKDFLYDIKRSALNLLSIIDDILDYSKIEAGKMSIERYPFDLRECVDDVFSMLGPTANKKGLELASLIYSDVPKSLLGDPIRIKQIITNLVNNAIKFTNSGSVEVHAEIEAETNSEIILKIQIKDTGIGLTDSQKERLFKAFSQADSTTKRVFGGTGLGLVISKSLVEKMQGKIEVESEANKGSNFWFTIKCERSETNENQYLTTQALTNKAALIFEPQSATRLAMTQMLEEVRMSVSSFDSLEDLSTEIELYSQSGKSVEVIIIGGKTFKRKHEQLREICQIASELKCPIITFGTSQDVDELNNLQALGVTRALRKPLSYRNLYNSLLDLLRGGEHEESQHLEVTNRKVLKNADVLAVDDNPANLRLVKILLEDLDINVDTAENGIEAISLSKNKVYDAIFMDIQMPEMDGLEATKTIRANNTNAQTPIIALTAHAMTNEKEILLSSGMDDYLTKPVSENDLIRTLLKWTKQIHTPKEYHTFEHSHEEQTIDWELSLKLANNNTELAIDMLKMLVDSNQQTRQDIHAAYQAQEFDTLLSHVHKLHGASSYIGAPKLKRLSSSYETKLKKKYYNQLEDVHNQLLAELEKINKESELYIE